MRLLFEIGTEELPAGEITHALNDLVAHIKKSAAEERLKIGKIHTFATPRRLALIVDNVAEKAEDKEEIVKGPSKKVAFDKEGNTTRAAKGFARGKKVSPEELIIVDTPKGPYIAALIKQLGKKASVILSKVLTDAFYAINWKRSMRWGWEKNSFARPVHWIVALLDKQILSVSFAGVAADKHSFGHRFMSPGSIEIDAPENYVKTLLSAKVMVDIEQRREWIREKITELAVKKEFTILMDESLLDEVVHLVEWPVPMIGHFAEELLELPREVLITSMATHQRYFALQKKDGQLANAFAFVSNIIVDRPHVIVAGNQRVLRARLEDARFFYREDRKKSLESRIEALKSIVYMKGLGSMKVRTERIVRIAEHLAVTLFPEKIELKTLAKRAALLSKADLSTAMVIEFTKLQGTIGRYYATADGEDKRVAAAIEEHYAPRSAADQPPNSRLGAIVAIAEKIDAIVGCFALNLIPSGSADPYALRRAAIGIIRVNIFHNLRFDLQKMIRFAFKGLKKEDSYTKDFLDEKKVVAEVEEFILVRLKALIAESNSADIADAVGVVAANDMPSAFARAKEVTRLRKNADFLPLAAAFKRVVNIIHKSEFRSMTDLIADQVNASIMTEKAEIELWEFVLTQKNHIIAAHKKSDFTTMATRLISMKSLIDSFFDHVMVMVDEPDIKRNRMGILAEIRRLFLLFADISKIQTKI